LQGGVHRIAEFGVFLAKGDAVRIGFQQRSHRHEGALLLHIGPAQGLGAEGGGLGPALEHLHARGGRGIHRHDIDAGLALVEQIVLVPLLHGGQVVRGRGDRQGLAAQVFQVFEGAGQRLGGETLGAGVEIVDEVERLATLRAVGHAGKDHIHALGVDGVDQLIEILIVEFDLDFQLLGNGPRQFHVNAVQGVGAGGLEFHGREDAVDADDDLAAFLDGIGQPVVQGAGKGRP